MVRFLSICAAGALGTGCRYLVGLWAGKTFGAEFPYGTLMVNVVGCFLMAVIMQIAVVTAFHASTWRLALTTGFLGGLTTYSSFNWETGKFIGERAWGAAAAYLGLTLVGCLLAGGLGVLLARRLLATE